MVYWPMFRGTNTVSIMDGSPPFVLVRGIILYIGSSNYAIDSSSIFVICDCLFY
jgi:hypothetical protein